MAPESANGNGISPKAIIGAALTALLLGFGSYVAGGAGKADDVKAQLDVFKAEMGGRLDVMNLKMQKQSDDIAEIKVLLGKR